MKKPVMMLLWKEWHEQRSKLGFGCLMLMSITAIALKTRLMPDVSVVWLGIFIGSFVLPLMAAMGVVAAERADRTLDRLISLPVRPWRLMAVKTLAGAVSCAAPLIGAALVTVFVAGNREIASEHILTMYCFGIGSAVVLFMWTLALGIGQPSEGRVGLVGLGVLGSLGVWLMKLDVAKISHGNWEIWSANPLSWMLWVDASGIDRRAMPYLPTMALVQLLICAGLWSWATARLTVPRKI